MREYTDEQLDIIASECTRIHPPMLIGDNDVSDDIYVIKTFEAARRNPCIIRLIEDAERQVSDPDDLHGIGIAAEELLDGPNYDYQYHDIGLYPDGDIIGAPYEMMEEDDGALLKCIYPYEIDDVELVEGKNTYIAPWVYLPEAEAYIEKQNKKD